MANNKKSASKKKQDIFVSVVVIAKSDTQELNVYIKSLWKLLSEQYTNYEIIIVDNGASVNEIAIVAKLLSTLPCIRIIKLSQQFRYDTAVFAGLEVSIGDYVCTLDATLDPIHDIPRFIIENQKKDVVQGVSTMPIHGAFGNQLGRRLFYWYNRKYIGIDVPLNATSFLSFSRRAINSLTGYNRRHKYIRHLARRVGYDYTTLAYTPTHNPSSQRTLRTGIIEAIEIVASYSTHPLRFVTWLGLVASVINVVYACYVLILNIFKSNVAPGWTSTSMQLSLMFFVLFIIMVILAEYIGRILTESHDEPSYFIADELNSTVALANTERRNVTK